MNCIGIYPTTKDIGGFRFSLSAMSCCTKLSAMLSDLSWGAAVQIVNEKDDAALPHRPGPVEESLHAPHERLRQGPVSWSQEIPKSGNGLGRIQETTQCLYL